MQLVLSHFPHGKRITPDLERTPVRKASWETSKEGLKGLLGVTLERQRMMLLGGKILDGLITRFNRSVTGSNHLASQAYKDCMSCEASF